MNNTSKRHFWPLSRGYHKCREQATFLVSVSVKLKMSCDVIFCRDVIKKKKIIFHCELSHKRLGASETIIYTIKTIEKNVIIIIFNYFSNEACLKHISLVRVPTKMHILAAWGTEIHLHTCQF